ncbi:hypothetical protein Tco_0140815 [Tanacetum coccineum]
MLALLCIDCKYGPRYGLGVKAWSKIYWAYVFLLPKSKVKDSEKVLKDFLWCQGDLARAHKESLSVKWGSMFLDLFNIPIPSLNDNHDKAVWRCNSGKLKDFCIKQTWEDYRDVSPDVCWKSMNWKDTVNFMAIAHYRAIKNVVSRIVFRAVVYYIWQEQSKRCFTSEKRTIKVLSEIILKTARFRISLVYGLRIDSLQYGFGDHSVNGLVSWISGQFLAIVSYSVGLGWLKQLGIVYDMAPKYRGLGGYSSHNDAFLSFGHSGTWRERDEWKEIASDQVEKIQSLEKDLEPRTQQLVDAKERVGVLEGEKIALSAELAQAEADCKKLVREFIPTVIKKLHTSVEYRKSLAALVQLCFTDGWLGGLSLGRTEGKIVQFLSETEYLDVEGSKSWEAKHRELFTMSYPYVQKIADSCDLPMSELLQVSPDIPPPSKQGEAFSGAAVEDAAQQPPTSAPKISVDTPFGTTT